ncbi:MAG: enoyl-CoA hydratase/isomerase family protein, partial [Bacteroidota bacterium]
MLQELAFCLQYAHITKSARVVIISAAGDTFCAGMDLKALAGYAEPYESDIAPSGQEILIGKMMQEVYKPLIADVRGSVYAGGFLILAGCHYVISKSSLQFALPEVKRGLFPMQVMASLSQVIPPRKVLDWCIRGYSIDVHKALDWGLITHIADYDQDTFVQQLADSITSNSPTAIRLGLEAYDHLHPSADL